MSTDSPTKNQIYREAGMRGARRRWGEPRVLRLDELTAAQRRLVVALVEAARAQNRDPSGEAA